MPPPAKKRRAEGGCVEVGKALAWLNSYPKAGRWMGQYNLEQLIEAGGGLAIVRNFLPGFVAEGALRILESLPAGRWNDTAAEEDYTHNNIAHRFWSVKAGGGGGDAGAANGGSEAFEALMRAFSLLVPEQYNAFSAARYERGHHIAPHDDRAYTPVRIDTGEVVSCSRDLTVIYYLTKDWEESMGGALVDLEVPPENGSTRSEGGASKGSANGSQQQEQLQEQQQSGRVYVPEFNSAVFFRVPRYHTVTPLRTDRPRYSVFGWFLQPGQLYDLFTGEEREQQRQQQLEAGEQQQDKQQPGADQQQDGEQQGGQKQRQNRKQQRRQQQPGADKEQQQRRQKQRQLDSEPLHCKLAQRLLAKAAAKQQRRQQLLEQG